VEGETSVLFLPLEHRGDYKLGRKKQEMRQSRGDQNLLFVLFVGAVLSGEKRVGDIE